MIGYVTATGLFLTLTPRGRSLWNRWVSNVQEADDATRYETRRKVEDTARAMQASFEADSLVFLQYRNGTPEQQSWASQALMRANTTAATYNRYLLENAFIWKGNIPPDIKRQLVYIQPETTTPESK
jgi:hypothetical protein